MAKYLSGGGKGGVGKTNVAINLAALLAANGRRVLMVDTDFDAASTSYWIGKRERSDRPAIRLAAAIGGGIEATLKPLFNDFDDIVIDCQGGDSEELRAALTFVDVALFPLQPSQADLLTAAKMAGLLRDNRRYNPGLKAYVVRSIASTHHFDKSIAKAGAMLAKYSELILAKTVIYNRSIYKRAFQAGLGVVEMPGRGNLAATEIHNLFAEFHCETESA